MSFKLDPTGLLFYHDTFDMEDEKRYKVFLNNTTDPKEKAIVVQFYHETPTQYFAQVRLAWLSEIHELLKS